MGKIIVKNTQFGYNWVLFFRKWYTDGWEIGQKIGMEKVRFRDPAGTSTYDFGKNTPPPVVVLHPSLMFGWCDLSQSLKVTRQSDTKIGVTLCLFQDWFSYSEIVEDLFFSLLLLFSLCVSRTITLLGTWHWCSFAVILQVYQIWEEFYCDQTRFESLCALSLV